jgi:hypothetical protein
MALGVVMLLIAPFIKWLMAGAHGSGGRIMAEPDPMMERPRAE